MPHSEEKYLHDIVDACNRIDTYTVGLSFDGFSSALIVFDAVARCLEWIGESVRQLTKHYPSTSHLFPDAAAMIGLRNILAHDYGEVDEARVWWVVQNKVPELQVRIEAELTLRKERKDNG
jgi:uncharacterized protein with HEPN domain